MNPSTAEVALVVMPFFSASRASLGASLLKAAADKRGYRCDVHYLNLSLAESIGIDDYTWIAEKAPPPALIGDWLFSSYAHNRELGVDNNDDGTYIQDVIFKRFLPNSFSPANVLRLLAIRDGLEAYLQKCLTYCDWNSYRIVGFTTTFNQNCSSIALARRLKDKWPATKIIFGGANCEGEMGQALLANYDCIDAVCSGEGENAFASYIEDIFGGGKSNEVHDKSRLFIKQKLESAIDLDTLPFPDLSDYYCQYERSCLLGSVQPLVPFETSRGCWWGEKHHCTFCGLNGLNMRFRSKSGDRAFDELKYLTSRWGRRVLCVDNILDLKYIKSFLPRIAQETLKVELHYEIKVNMRKSELLTLAEAGVRAVQPGIESFITTVLKLMDKGTSMLQNVQLMRWCKEIGINVAWNLIYGFPGEDASLYPAMIRLLPRLFHMDAPQNCCRVRADRHSPYFMRPEKYGVRLIEEPAYKLVYPLQSDQVSRIAYYFDMEFRESPRILEYESDLQNAVAEWSGTGASQAVLNLGADGEGAYLVDTRPYTSQTWARLSSQELELILACDAITGLGRLKGLPIWSGGSDASRTGDLLVQMVERGWLLQEDQKFVSLAIVEPSVGRLLSPNDCWLRKDAQEPVYLSA